MNYFDCEKILVSLMSTDRALLKPTMAGDMMILPGAMTPTPSLMLPHHYCFSSASHAGSFYLKIGAAGKEIE